MGDDPFYGKISQGARLVLLRCRWSRLRILLIHLQKSQTWLIGREPNFPWELDCFLGRRNFSDKVLGVQWWGWVLVETPTTTTTSRTRCDCANSILMTKTRKLKEEQRKQQPPWKIHSVMVQAPDDVNDVVGTRCGNNEILRLTATHEELNFTD